MNPLELKYDLGKVGLKAFLEPWQVTTMKILWDADKPMSSREVWISANKRLQVPRCRASIINFLQYLLDQGILEGIDITGKSGHHNLYRPGMSEAKFNRYVVDLLIRKLVNEYPSET